MEYIEETGILRVEPFSEMGTIVELINSFGGKENYLKAVAELEKELYTSRKNSIGAKCQFKHLFIKIIQDIMRKDTGVDGDAQRMATIVWLIFLKIFDDKRPNGKWSTL